MTNFRSLALAAALLGSISLPALAQGSNVTTPATPAIPAKPVAAQTHAKGTTVHAPLHRIAGTTEAKPATDAKAPVAKGAVVKPATPAAASTTGTAAATTVTPAAKPVDKTN